MITFMRGVEDISFYVEWKWVGREQTNGETERETVAENGLWHE